MDMGGFLRALPVLYETNLHDKEKVTPLLLGPMGHAKTAVGEAAAKILTKHTGREYRAHIGQPMLEPFDDIRGMGIPQRKSDGTLISEYTYPHLLPLKEHLMSTVLVWDEFTKAQEDTVLCLGNALLERRLGDVIIPPECFIICTGNRAGVDKSKDLNLPGHVIDRLLMIDWRLTFRDWQPWAMAKKIHPITVAFASQFEHRVFSGAAPPDRNVAFCTPRGLTIVDRLIQNWIKLEGKTADTGYYPVTNYDLKNLIAGKIGDAAAEDLSAYSQVGRHMPSWDEIKRSPNKAKLPGIDDELGPAAMHAVAMMIAGNVDSRSVPAAVAYIQRMPDEYRIPVIVKLGVDFSAEAAAAGWLQVMLDNAELTAASLQYMTAS